METSKLVRLLRSIRGLPTRPGWRCPGEGPIAAYIDGRLPREKRELLESHLADCDHCLAQVSSLTRTISQETPQVPPELLTRASNLVKPGSELSGSTSRWLWPAIPATATLLILGVLYLVLPSTVSEIPMPLPAGTLESDERTQARDFSRPLLSPRVLEPREGQTLDRDSVTFTWRRLKGTLFYEITVVDSTGDLVWESRSQETETTAPPGLPFQNDETYFFWVRAHLEEGKTVKSPAVSFRVSATR